MLGDQARIKAGAKHAPLRVHVKHTVVFFHLFDAIAAILPSIALGSAQLFLSTRPQEQTVAALRKALQARGVPSALG